MSEKQLLALGLVLSILGINWIMPDDKGNPGRLIRIWNAAWGINNPSQSSTPSNTPSNTPMGTSPEHLTQVVTPISPGVPSGTLPIRSS